MWYLDIYLCVTNPALCNDKLVSQCAACSGSPSGRKGPATYTRYFALGMQSSPALQLLFSFHLGCGYARKKKKKALGFSSNGGVFSVCGLILPLSFAVLQMCVCVWSVDTHCGIHKAHFSSSPCLAQLFCFHCTLVWLFCCEIHLLSSPNPILAWLVWANSPVFSHQGMDELTSW